MEQPPGFINPDFPNHVCHLKKAIYGLKQAPRAWFDRFSLFLLQIGFFCSKENSSLFVLHCAQGTILLLLYVDDIILTSSNPELLSCLIFKLSKEFSMTDLGPIHYFLGVEVVPFKGEIFLSQSKYASEILKKTGMLASKPANTPLAQEHNLHQSTGNQVDATFYRSVVGALQYAANLVYQFMHQPYDSYFQAVKRILRSIKYTMDYGMKILSQSSLCLYAFSDADWAGCPTTRRSTTSYCVYPGANCISWATKKQPTVARSSAEAEYRALASTAAEII